MVLVNCSTQRKSSNIHLIAYDDKDNVLDTLVNEIQNVGNYSIEDDEFQKFSGIVIFKLETEDSIVTKKLIMSK